MRSTALCLLLATTTSACWVDRAAPARPQPLAPDATATTATPPPTTRHADQTEDYRAWTIAFDAVGVAALVGGAWAIRNRGLNDNVGGSLLVGGAVVGGYGAIITHLAHHRTDRAWRSFLVRSMLSNVGLVAGLAAGCPDGRTGLGSLDCSMSGMMYGIAGGIAVAGAFDALVLQNDTRWVPTASVGADGGAHVGVATAF